MLLLDVEVPALLDEVAMEPRYFVMKIVYLMQERLMLMAGKMQKYSMLAQNCSEMMWLPGLPSLKY